jgi:hypothetical protein
MLRTFLAPGGNRTAASSLAASTIARASQGWLTQRETRAGPTTPRNAPAKIYLHGRWASVRLELAMSRRTWIGLALLCVVIWLVADSQGPRSPRLQRARHVSHGASDRMGALAIRLHPARCAWSVLFGAVSGLSDEALPLTNSSPRPCWRSVASRPIPNRRAASNLPWLICRSLPRPLARASVVTVGCS